MVFNKKRFLFLIFAIACVFCAIFGAFINKNDVKMLCAEDVFTYDDNISVTQNYKVSAPGISDDRYGILLKTNTEKTTFELGSDMCGLFSLDFRAFTNTAYVAGSKTYDDTLTAIQNSVYAIKNVSIHLVDANDATNTLTIGIDGASYMNFAVPQAYVEYQGSRAGEYTYRSSSYTFDYTTSQRVGGNTSGANSRGVYTGLYGTSFSNTSYLKDEVAVANPYSTKICFDPSTSEVYAMIGETKIRIWDFSKASIDGKIMPLISGFEQYNATLCFETLTGVGEAQLVLYDLCGQSLGGANLETTVGPRVYAQLESNALLGEKYVLPQPSVYDVLGKSVGSVSVKASVGGKNMNIYNAQGNVTTIYQEGCYIIPSADGELILQYSASNGVYDGSCELKAYAFGSAPAVSYDFESEISEGAVGTNAFVYFPKATVSTEMFFEEKDALISIYKNDAPLTGYQQRELPLAFTFEEVGAYRVDYECGNAQKKSFYYEVLEGQVAFSILGEIPKQVQLNESLSVPAAEIRVGTSSISAEIYLCEPDGGYYQISSESMSFSKAGKYTITYMAHVFGVEYAKEVSFTVLGVPASFSNFENTPGASCVRYETITGLQLKSSHTSISGAYSQVLDLSKSTKDDVLIEMFNSTPWGEVCENIPTIVLRDAHNSKNYLTIEARYTFHPYRGSYFAAAPGQTLIGLYADGTIVEKKPSAWATDLYFSMSPILTYDRPIDKQCISLSYDAEEKAIYCSGVCIIDFDADYQSLPWSGFTTGEVILEISNIKNVVITQVYGVDFTSSTLNDTAGPEITVDCLKYTQTTLPNGVVGKPYKIFEATALDRVSGVASVKSRVFKDYGKNNYVECSIVNGCVTPTKAGSYTIEYSAKDEFGNVSVKLLNFEVVEATEIQDITFEISGQLPGKAYAGLYLSIPQFRAISGGVDTRFENYEKIVTVFDANGNEVDVDNNQILADEIGTYTIEYCVLDFVGNQKIVEYKVDIVANIKPIIKEVLFPEVVLKGISLELPAIEAVDYTSGSKNENPQRTITASLNGTKLSIDETNSIALTEAGDLVITYTAYASTGYYATKQYKVKVVNADFETGFMKNYFYSTDTSLTKTIDSSGLVLTATKSNTTVSYTNRVLANGFSVQMYVNNPTSTNLNKVTVNVYDSLDRSISVSIDLIKGSSEQSLLSVNGGIEKAISGSFANTVSPFGFTYYDNVFLIKDLQGNAIAYIDRTANGEAFNGFPSGKVWFDISFGEFTTSTAELRIIKINNQPISNTASDTIAPEIYIDGFLPKEVLPGQSFTVPSAIVQDVLSYKANVLLDIKMGGKVVYNDIDITKPFTLSLNEIGTYSFVYKLTAETGSAPVKNNNRSLKVVEYEKPQMVLNGEMITQASVGDTLKYLPSVTITDNYSSSQNMSLSIFILEENGAMRRIEYTEVDGKYLVQYKSDYASESISAGEYVFKTAGTYTIRYWCYDQHYNYVMQDYVITVK